MNPLLLTTLVILLSSIDFSTTDAARMIDVDNFDSSAMKWEFYNGQEYPGAKGAWNVKAGVGRNGGKAGELSFDFSGGGNYVQSGTKLPKANGVSAIRLWIKKPGSNSLAARLTDSEGQTFQKTFNLASADWQEVEIGLFGWAVSWGQKSDGIFRGEPTEFAIVVDNNSARTGAILLDDVRMVTESKGKGESDHVAYTALTVPKNGSINTDLALLGKPSKLLLDIDALESGSITIVIASHFHTYQTEISVASAGKQTIGCAMGGMEDWKLSGSEQGLLYPLRLVRISPSAGIHASTLRIETVVEKSDRIVMVPEGKMEGNNARFRCNIQSILPVNVKGRLEYRISNWSGEQVSSGSLPVAVSAGQSVVKTVTVSTAGEPFLECEYSFVTPDLVYGPAIAAATSGVQARQPAKLQPTSPWGIGVYLYRYANDKAGLEKMDAAAALAQAAGVKWSREEMQWHRIEPKPGEFDWSFYDEVVDTAERHGISVYGLIAYWSTWTKPYTPQGIAEYAKFCTALVTRYKGRIKHWEIWNEPNIFFWDGPKELYPELLKAAYKAIKAVDPESVVLGCSTAGIDRGFIEMTQKAGAPYDILTVHPYRALLDDSAFMEELRDTVALTAQTGKQKPVWITEMGWPTPIGGISEREQAKLLARCYLSAVASGINTNISWYDFRDDGDNPFYHEHRFGVIRSDLDPKPAYRALASVCNRLPDAKLKKALEMPSGLLGYTFSTSDGDRSVLWAKDQSALVCLESEESALRATDLMGQQVQMLTHAGVYYVPLQKNSPIFIDGQVRVAKPSVTVSVSKTLRAGRPGLISVIGKYTEGLTFEVGEAQGWKVKPGGDSHSWRIIPPKESGGQAKITLKVSGGAKAIRFPLILDIAPKLVKV